MIRKIVYIIVITLFFQIPSSAIAGSVDSEELKNKSAIQLMNALKVLVEQCLN